jgi:FkbM family methyltransferase
MKALSAQAKTQIAATIFRLPIPLSLWGLLEKLAAIAQGKGWGMSSIHQEVNVCLSLLGREPQVICDVGANRGDYSWELLRRNGRGQFYLFEPSATNLHILMDRYRAFPQVKIFPVALSNQKGSAILFASTPGSGEASLSEVQGEGAATKMEHQESIATERLDAFGDELTQSGSTCIDLVKIDVEGHELAVLEGCGELIQKIRMVQFEYGSRNLDTRTNFRDFWSFFQRHGFCLHRITPRGAQAIPSYSVWQESLVTTNFVAINQRLPR